MKKIILGIGIAMIILVTVCTFLKDEIIYQYSVIIVKNDEKNRSEGEYYLEDHFSYVNNYDELNIKSKDDLIDYIYYSLNTGNVIKRYADKSYDNYLTDLDTLKKDDTLSDIVPILNNFVHPFNSVSDIYIMYGIGRVITVEPVKAYTDDEIDEINEIVNKIINENITNNMPIKEKIKVIHDYIIENTDYDKLKINNKEDNTYKSQTAYGVLKQGYGICSGYADTMAIFLDRLNVINYKISNDSHIWNLVYLDGKWYHLDLTWDDPINNIGLEISDKYFLIDYETLVNIDDDVHNFDVNIYKEAVN